MKKLLIAGALMAVMATPVFAAKPNDCATIKDGTILDKAGNLITSGYDEYGYNYQAHMFNGYYGNYSRPAILATSGDRLMMKWSDSWLANVDCNGDNKLDRGLINGEQTGNISRGWLTNHWMGEYEVAGKVQHFTDFVKIVWTGPGGSLWGQYEIIQEVWNDKQAGYSGLLYKMPSPGFGLNNHWTE